MKPNQVKAWVGAYNTTTQWWGGYFSPLEVHPDGRITIRGGVSLSYDYDPNKAQVTIGSAQDWNPSIAKPKDATELEGKFWGAKFTFSKDENSRNVIHGTLRPRGQDASVTFNGVKGDNPNQVNVDDELMTENSTTGEMDSTPVSQIRLGGEIFLSEACKEYGEGKEFKESSTSSSSYQFSIWIAVGYTVFGAMIIIIVIVAFYRKSKQLLHYVKKV